MDQDLSGEEMSHLVQEQDLQRERSCQHVIDEEKYQAQHSNMRVLGTHNRGFDEPPRIANRIKQSQRLLHAVNTLILVEHLVVLAERD